MSKFQFMSGGEVWPDRQTLSLKKLVAISLGAMDRALRIKDKEEKEFSPSRIEIIEAEGRKMVVVHLQAKKPRHHGVPFKIPKDFDLSLPAVARFEDGRIVPMIHQGDTDASGREAVYVDAAPFDVWV